MQHLPLNKVYAYTLLIHFLIEVMKDEINMNEEISVATLESLLINLIGIDEYRKLIARNPKDINSDFTTVPEAIHVLAFLFFDARAEESKHRETLLAAVGIGAVLFDVDPDDFAYLFAENFEAAGKDLQAAGKMIDKAQA